MNNKQRKNTCAKKQKTDYTCSEIIIVVTHIIKYNKKK